MVAVKEADAPPLVPGAAREEPQSRLRSVEAALGLIHKKFGPGSIMRLGARQRSDVRVISTGSLSLDWALGVGGFPRGRIVEVFGPESSGKTTLALHVIANAQRAGGIAALSTPSTPSIRPTRAGWGSTSSSSSSRSPTAASRRWRSSRCS